MYSRLLTLHELYDSSLIIARKEYYHMFSRLTPAKGDKNGQQGCTCLQHIIHPQKQYIVISK
jgi:hypothetical protein